VSLHTAVPSAPRADDPASPRAALRGASRDRRAVLSPWGGTAPTRRADRSGDAASRPPCRLAPAARRLTGRVAPGRSGPRPPCRPNPVGRRGAWFAAPPLGGVARTAVSPSEGGGGRHGL